MHTNRDPCNSFLMVKMASGMDHGHVWPTTVTTASHNIVTIQLIPSHAVLYYSISLCYYTCILFIIDSFHIKKSANQYLVTIRLRAQQDRVFEDDH